MADAYFDYVLSQCRSQNIKSICEVVSTRKQLIEKANEIFNGCNNITADWRFMRAVQNCFYKSQIINSHLFDSDTREVFDRCYHSIDSNEKLSYKQFFEALVDFNWVMAGIHNSQVNRCSTVKLQVNHHEIIKSTKEFLLDIYSNAIEEYNKCIYIDEALKAKKKFLPHFYDFKFQESRYYASHDFTSFDLQDIKQEHHGNSIEKMSLFYGLTATAVLAEDIRRFG